MSCGSGSAAERSHPGAIHELPARTFFGSDAPYGDPVLARTTVERVTAPGEVRDRVLGGNLAELLGLA